MLASHPDVVSPQETHLFDEFLGIISDQWSRQNDRVNRFIERVSRGEAPQSRLVGLPTILDDSDFLEACLAFAQPVWRNALSAKDGARLILEKTPAHSRRVDLINQLYPTAKFIHVIRNPEEVVASLLRVSEWSEAWAIRDARSAARVWRDSVRGALAGRAFGDRYLELRYDEVVQDPSRALRHTLEFLDVSSDSRTVSQLAATHGEHPRYALAPRLRDANSDALHAEPPGFAGGSRRHPSGLSAWQSYQVRRIVQPAIEAVGFDWDWVSAGRTPMARAMFAVAFSARDAEQKARSVVRRRL